MIMHTLLASTLLLTLMLANAGRARATTGPTGSDRAGARCLSLWGEHADRMLAHTPKSGSGAKQVVFVHVARTAGSNFQTCFLKHITDPKRRCPEAYVDPEKLHSLVRSMPDCYSFTSHLDASVMEFLPNTDTHRALITQLRDPVSRVISMYEYTIESASRMHEWSLSGKNVPDHANPNSALASTVWPWNYLMPFMKEDITEKMARLKEAEEAGTAETGWIKTVGEGGEEFFFNKATNESKWTLSEGEDQEHLLPLVDPYDNSMVMSLMDFVRSPMAHEVVHNGQAHQILGISNVSMWGGVSRDLRACMDSDTESLDDGAELLGSTGSLDAARKLATSLMGRYLHVGVSEKLETSVETAAVAFNFPLNQTAYDASPNASKPGSPSYLGKTLGFAFQECSLYMTQHASGDRAMHSLKMPDGRVVAFSRAARKRIPAKVIDYIRKHNLLDIALHSEAEHLLDAQRADFERAATLQKLPTMEEVHTRNPDLAGHVEEWHAAKSGAVAKKEEL